MHAVVEEVTENLRRRSHVSRQAYLERCRRTQDDTPPKRTLSCGNMAHGYAACNDTEKQMIGSLSAPNIGIITAVGHAHLERFKSLDVVAQTKYELAEAVIAAGETTSGCTVHYADQSYDTGPVILQKSCDVLPDDTPDTLNNAGAARVLGLVGDVLIRTATDESRVTFVAPAPRQRRAALGVMLNQADDDEPGVVLGQVVASGPAGKAGLQAGDRITAVNGDAIEDFRALRGVLRSSKPGEEVTLTVVRDGEELEVEVELGGR